ncbi:MAG: hypothetical protein WD848_10495 [Dehalococcoidia bacterium]
MQFVKRRSRGDLGLLLGAFTGIVIAAAVVSGGPVYLRSLEKIGVQEELRRIGPYNGNIQVNTPWVPLQAAEFEDADAAVRQAELDHLSSVERDQGLMVKTVAHYWGTTETGALRDPLASRAAFHLIRNMDQHVTYVDGRSPSDVVETVDGVTVVEASVYETRAEALEVQVGDVLEAVPEQRGVGLVRVRVTGIFRVVDPAEEFWLALTRPLFEPTPIVEGRGLPLGLFMSGDAIFNGVGPVNAGLPANYTWITYTDRTVLGEMRSGEIASMVEAFEQQLTREVVQPTVLSSLRPAFRSLENRITFARIPMLLMAALATATVGYYLFLVAGLLARKRDSDTVMLRSRGLSVLQIAKLYALEAAVLVGIPVLATPLLSAAVISQMGRLPIYESITAGNTLPVDLTWVAWAWSAAAGATAFVVLLAPALAAARRGVAGEREAESRPERPPLFQRYFIDVLLLVLGGLVWWELRARGTVVTSGEDGGPSVDLTLLFAPAIFLAAIVLIFLRLFPLVTKLVSLAASRSNSAWAAIGFWRLGRSPYWYTWPILLLVFTAGLGVISGTLGATLQRSSMDQISYETATDLRIAPNSQRGPVDRGRVEEANAIPGVELATPAFRRTAQVGTTSVGSQFTMLAVDITEFPQVAWFRDDFADEPLADLLRQVEARVKPEPIYIPEDAEELGVRVMSDPRVDAMFLWAILRDVRGRVVTVTFGQIEGEWRLHNAAMPTGQAPYELVSLQAFQQAGPDGSTPATMYIDDLHAITEDGETATVVDFDSAELWTPLPTSQGLDTGLVIVPSSNTMVDGGNMARVTMGRGNDRGVRGLYRTATGGPLPVIASSSFLGVTNARPGEPFVVSVSGAFVPVVIVDTVDLFPTLDPSRAIFLLADVRGLVEMLELRGLSDAQPNELFVSTDPEQHGQALAGLHSMFPTSRVYDRPALLQSSLIDPLAVAGWRGMGLIAVALTAIAGCLGYVTYLAAHNMRTRHDSAYLLALGLSRRAFLRIVMVEHVLVAVLGVALGLVSGLMVSRLAVSSMAHTETGGALLPPFVLQTSWIQPALLVGVVALTAAVIIGGILLAYPRLPLHMLTRARG